MYMQIDQSRQQIRAAEIHDLIAAGDLCIRNDIRNAFPIDQNRTAANGLHVLCPVQNDSVLQSVFHFAALPCVICFLAVTLTDRPQPLKMTIPHDTVFLQAHDCNIGVFA